MSDLKRPTPWTTLRPPEITTAAMIAIVLLAWRRLGVAFLEGGSHDPREAQQGFRLAISGLSALLAAEASPAATGL